MSCATQLSIDADLDVAVPWAASSASASAPFEDDGPLVQAATPVLDRLEADLVGSEVAVTVTNAHGAVLDRRGNERVDDSPTGVASAGVVITHPATGRVAGVLDMASPAGDPSGLLLPLAIRAAQDIQQRLVDDGGLADRLVLQRFLQERRGAKNPFVIVSDRRILANAAADRLLSPSDEPVLRAFAAAGRGGTTGEELELSRGTVVAVRAESIEEGGSLHGTILRLMPLAGGGPRGRTVGWDSLTGTERSVSEVIAQGMTNKQAGERLFMSPHTVGFHLRSIYRKLGIGSRVDLTRATLAHLAVEA